jgi:dephospho-CoA kinase
VIVAGGPGSGKSFIRKVAFSGDKISVVNSDLLFELELKKTGVSKKIDDQHPDYDKQMVLRDKAKDITSRQAARVIDRMLPFVVEGTGHKLRKILDIKHKVEEVGYDCGLVFVNTSLEVAWERNLKRERSLSKELLVANWKNAQANIGSFQDEFKDNFVVVDNDEVISQENMNDFINTLHKKVGGLIRKPLKNIKGRKIIDQLNKIGGHALSDIGISIEFPK